MSKRTAPMAKTEFSPGFRSRKALKPAGFTLIELLTVIAIIAILAAIIFPVYSTIRENARRANCMSNMQRLYQATRQFELDNRRYPDFLFGPALDANGLVATGGTAVSMDQVKSWLNATIVNPADPNAKIIRNAQLNYKNSLYPEYINDLSVFKCPDNISPGADNVSSTKILSAERLDKDATLDADGNVEMPAGKNAWPYYVYDSYDANPSLDNSGKTTAQATVRYARERYTLMARSTPPGSSINDLAGDTSADGQKAYGQYKNQLVFANPSTDSVLTMCTYHSANYGKIVVLWLNGQAKVLDSRRLLPYAPPNGQPAYFPQTPYVHDYDFFKMTPTGQ